MKIWIVEDEPIATKQLHTYLNRYDPGIEVTAFIESGAELKDHLKSQPLPDLIFSDIQLQDGDVFSALETTPVECPIIFATAYDHYVLQAFETSGIAYLLKPIEYEAVAAALQKYARLGRAFGSATHAQLTSLHVAITGTEYRARLAVRRKSGIFLLKVEDIAYIKVQDEETSAFDGRGRVYPLKETLSALEQDLDPKRFFRLNRSEMVHVDFIERVEPHGKDRLLIRLSGHQVTLTASASKTPALRRWLGM